MFFPTQSKLWYATPQLPGRLLHVLYWTSSPQHNIAILSESGSLSTNIKAGWNKKRDKQRKPKNHNYVCIRLYRNKASFKNSCAAYEITELRICSVLSCIFYRSQNKQQRHFMAFLSHSRTAQALQLPISFSLPYLPAARLCYLLFTLSEKNRSSPLTVWHLRTFVALDFPLCPEPNYFLLCLKDTPNSAAFMTPAPLSRPGPCRAVSQINHTAVYINW